MGSEQPSRHQQDHLPDDLANKFPRVSHLCWVHNIGKHAGAFEIITAERDSTRLKRARETKNLKVWRSQADMPNSPSRKKFSKGVLSSSYTFFIPREKYVKSIYWKGMRDLERTWRRKKRAETTRRTSNHHWRSAKAEREWFSVNICWMNESMSGTCSKDRHLHKMCWQTSQ